MAESKIDPFDVEALEKSLNDSATRVSTIWVSFLIFSLYLVTAATTVTHRQLFLAEPVKLPVLNIDLPLWGFFFLAPILFVIMHAYVLIQVILLGRTAAAYSEAVDRSIHTAADNALVRQRLANTLFAQIFAGSPREREGWLGLLLRAIAWMTLAIAPVLVVLTFQFMFLPYHSHVATWTHRLLLFIEVTMAFLLWPFVLNAERELRWDSIRSLLIVIRTHLVKLLSTIKHLKFEWRRLPLQAVPLITITFLLLISILIGAFPGEPHVNLATGNHPFSVLCGSRRLINRLDLQGIDVIDQIRRSKEQNAPTPRSDIRNTYILALQARDFNCGVFDKVDLRHVDFSRSRMIGASFHDTQLDAASFNEAELQDSSFSFAKIQRATFEQSNLGGADLSNATAIGTTFRHSRLQGAALDQANLTGADLSGAQLHVTTLRQANLRGTFLIGSTLIGADLSDANLQGAFLSEAELQAAKFDGANLNKTIFERTYLWRASGQSCKESRITESDTNNVIVSGGNPLTVREQKRPITEESVQRLITSLSMNLNAETRSRVVAQIETSLLGKMEEASAALKTWEDCASISAAVSEGDFFRGHSDLLRDIACNEVFYWKPVMEGIVDNWIFNMFGPQDRVDYLGRMLLGLDNRECRSLKHIDDFLKERVRARLNPTSKEEPGRHQN